ncbi:hypothetical protein MMC28_002199 [Mycoblastus sanguinarius]|nr:hypothetical protein [Mycoblastus sanguinarius]
MSTPSPLDPGLDQAKMDAEEEQWEDYSSPEPDLLRYFLRKTERDPQRQVSRVREDPPPDPQCTCSNNCTAHCPCHKFGSGCSSVCHCAASGTCKNRLNDLAHLFGVEPNLERPMRATACFTQYLATKRSSNRIEIEIKRLRRKLMGLRRRNSDDTPRGDPFHGEDSDNVLREWKDTWVAGFSNDERRVKITSSTSTAFARAAGRRMLLLGIVESAANVRVGRIGIVGGVGNVNMG